MQRHSSINLQKNDDFYEHLEDYNPTKKSVESV